VLDNATDSVSGGGVIVTDGGTDDGLEEVDRGRNKADNLFRVRLEPDSAPPTSRNDAGREAAGVAGPGGAGTIARDTSVVWTIP